MFLESGLINKLKDKIALLFLIAVALASTAIFTYLCWKRHMALFNYEYIDLAEIINLSWNTACGRIFYQTINPNQYGLFSLHFSPIILLIAGFFIIFKHPISIYIAYNFVLAAAAIPLFCLGKRVLNDSLTALAISLAYIFYAPLRSMYMLSDLDPALLAIPFIFLFFVSFEKKKIKMVFVWTLLILACKEDMGLLVSVLGVYLLCHKHFRRAGVLMLISGFFYFLIVARLISLFGIYNKESLYVFLKYNSFAENLDFIILHPGQFLSHIAQCKHDIILLQLLKPVFFFPLLSYELYLSASSVLHVFLCKRAMEFGRTYYAFSIVPFMFIALVYMLRRIRNRFTFFSENTRMVVVRSLGFLFVFSCFYSNFVPNLIGYLREDRLNNEAFRNVDNIYDKRFYEFTKDAKTAWELINLIPKDAPVMATADLCAPLATRKTVYVFPYPYSSHNAGSNEPIDFERMRFFLATECWLPATYFWLCLSITGLRSRTA